MAAIPKIIVTENEMNVPISFPVAEKGILYLQWFSLEKLVWEVIVIENEINVILTAGIWEKWHICNWK